MREIRVAFAAAVLALVLAGVATGAARDSRVDLVAYSTPRDAFAKIIPAFQATPAGKGASFSESYGASGEQARAVAAGLPADVLELSLQPDMTDLVKGGVVPYAWNHNAYHGFVTNSLMKIALFTRPPSLFREKLTRSPYHDSMSARYSSTSGSCQ